MSGTSDVRVLWESYQDLFFNMDRIEYNHQVCENSVFFTGLIKRHIMIELICRASHGQTLGYCREKDKVVPCLEKMEDEAFVKAGYDKYIDGILSFTSCYHKAVKQFPINSSRIDIMYQYLKYLSEEPSEEILSFYGDLPNNETGREQRTRGYAPAL